MQKGKKTALLFGVLLLSAPLLLVLTSKQSEEKESTSTPNVEKVIERASDNDTGAPDPRAYPGFTLFGESGSALTKLVNLGSDVVKTFQFDAARARLLPNCNVLVVHGTKWGWSQKKWDALRPFVREYDWDGKVVWEHEVPGPAHHDVQRLENGNTLILYRSLVPKSAKSAIEDPEKRNSQIRTDIIREVSPEGEIIWSWAAHDHLDLNSCGQDPCEPLPSRVTDGGRVFDWTHSNGISLIPKNRWYESGDTRFTPGNIVLTLRNWSTVVIISKESGEVVWRYDERLSGGHEGLMIEQGLPGAGNILIFNNGRDDKESEVIELDPLTKEVTWRYADGKKFFSRAAGVAQRLPNGNTLISEDVPGRIFEVTPEGEKVWKFHATMRTARAHRYPANHCPSLKELPLS